MRAGSVAEGAGTEGARTEPRPPGNGSLSSARRIIPLSFVVCISDQEILRANLLGSPCLKKGSPHQVISAVHAPSAAAGWNAALESARHEWVVLAHQDVFLPAGWDRRIMRQLREAEQQFGPLGVAGVYGVGDVEQPPEGPLQAERIGWVVDRGWTLRERPALPARVATLDELLLILPRGTPLRADPTLGFHLYGADLCLQAREHGLAVVALEALCQHNSRSVGLNETFLPSARAFALKWAGRLPIATPCVVFDRTGQVFHFGNSTDEASVARAVGGPLQQNPTSVIDSRASDGKIAKCLSQKPRRGRQHVARGVSPWDENRQINLRLFHHGARPKSGRRPDLGRAPW